MAEIVVLVSAGRHPVTGRPRPADLDSRALALAGSLVTAGHAVTAVHAGPDDEVLRAYGGFGIGRLVRLDVPEDADALVPLLRWLEARRPTLVLAGSLAERGAATGQLPYALAHALGGSCIPGIAAIEELDEHVTLVQAWTGGRRRRLAAPLPAVAIASHAAPPATGWAYASAARSVRAVETMPVHHHAMAKHQAAISPFRVEPPRPLAQPVKKIRGSAAARMAAATSFTAGKGRLLVHPDPQEAAQAILDYLKAEGLLRR